MNKQEKGTVAVDNAPSASAPTKYDLLAPELPRSPRDPFCWGCGRHPETVPQLPQDYQAFRKLVGVTWRWPSLRLNLERDRKTLGLTWRGVGPATFCLPCTLAHMRRFNYLRQERLRKQAS